MLLHDHLDGGLRPATLVELARGVGYDGLPTTHPDELARLIREGARRKSLEAYLEPFRHTLAVMQERDAIERIAAECVEDLAADGVVYAEVRQAPEACVARGLTLDEVIEAILAGFRRGSEAREITVRLIVSAMRTSQRSLEVAQAAVRHRDEGVVGFDLAGAEAGHPPSEHLDAFRYVADENLHVTVHAGEAAGVESIHEAIHSCGAERIGHGVRILDDIDLAVDDEAPTLGRLASYVRDRGIPLEMSPSSNVHTGAVPLLAQHPIDRLRHLGFKVTVNTDNRLMSGVSLGSELAAVADAFGLGIVDIRDLTLAAMRSAFLPYDERVRLIDDVIRPGYERLRPRSVPETIVGAATAVPAAIADAATHVPGAIADAAVTIGNAAGAAAGQVISAARPILQNAVGSTSDGRPRPRVLARQPLAILFEVHPEARNASPRELGVRTIPVSAIKGSAVEGPHQRGGDFLPIRALRGRDWETRWQRIRRAHEALVILPPIDVYKFGDGYWVIDGHNRVAAALYNDQPEIDAFVIELRLAGVRSEPPATGIGPSIAGAAELRAAGRGRFTRSTSFDATSRAPVGDGPTRRSTSPVPDRALASARHADAPDERAAEGTEGDAPTGVE